MSETILNDARCIRKNTCDLEDLQPAILNIPYPPIQVECENTCYAKLLLDDYCGLSSELTAITQYINHEIRLSLYHCEISQTLLSIAEAEMLHLQMLGELIVLLGHSLKYNAYPDGLKTPWSPDFISFKTNTRSMILSDIKGERQAISQYKCHIKQIDDPYITAVLQRIIKDEEYHITLLTDLLKDIDSKKLEEDMESEV